jgi:hypothetical protein
MLPQGEIVVNGDVCVTEANSLFCSDGLRFTDAQGRLNGVTADRMIFYSDLGFGEGSLADSTGATSFPANFLTGRVGPSVAEGGNA